MSYSKELIETFPIENNQGIYYFRHIGEFEIVNSIGSGIFSEIYTAKPKNQVIQEDSNKFIILKISLQRKFSSMKFAKFICLIK